MIISSSSLDSLTLIWSIDTDYLKMCVSFILQRTPSDYLFYSILWLSEDVSSSVRLSFLFLHISLQVFTGFKMSRQMAMFSSSLLSSKLNFVA
jgi:hypothetical protein